MLQLLRLLLAVAMMLMRQPLHLPSSAGTAAEALLLLPAPR
jgi:hypothetical protein